MCVYCLKFAIFIKKICSLSVIVLWKCTEAWNWQLPFSVDSYVHTVCVCAHTYTYSVGPFPTQSYLWCSQMRWILKYFKQCLYLKTKKLPSHNEKWNCNTQDYANFYLGIVCAFLVLVDIKVFDFWHCNTYQYTYVSKF